jgi:peptidoglycan hydrolase-like protein with peptidoglycan-binding domain
MASWYSRILTIGCVGADVELVQRKLRATTLSGVFDAETASRVRGIQWADKLPVTGIVDSTTANAIGESVRLGFTPDWFSRDMAVGDTGDDVAHLRVLLGYVGGATFDTSLEAAVRRFQSAHHLPLTGVMGEADATVLGDDAPWRAA